MTKGRGNSRGNSRSNNRRKPAATVVDESVIIATSKCLHELYAHADAIHIQNTLRMVGLPFDLEQIQNVFCRVCQESRKYPMHPTFDCLVTKPMQKVLVDVAHLPGVVRSDPKTQVLLKCVFLYDFGSGFYLVRRADHLYNILQAVFELLKLAHKQGSYGTTIRKSANVVKELTFRCEDVRTWSGDGFDKSHHAIRRLRNFAHGAASLSKAEFDNMCWSTALGGTVPVKLQTTSKTEPRLHLVFLDKSKKLLKTLGLPERFSTYAAMHFADIHNMMADNRPEFESDKLPYEKHCGRKHRLERVDPFGCLIRFLDGNGPTRLGLLLGYGRARSLDVVDYYTQEITTIEGAGMPSTT